MFFMLCSIVVYIIAYGSAWLSQKLFPFLCVLTWITLGLVVFIFLPLAIPRRTRSFAGMALIGASFVFNITLWVMSLLVTLEIWGWGASFWGIMTGIGIVPIAMAATLFNGILGSFIILVLLAIMGIGCLWLGYLFHEKSSKYYNNGQSAQ